MLRLLLIFLLFERVYCSCPAGFELVRDGECRGNYVNATVSYDNAFDIVVAKCNEINGLPIIIHDDEHYTYWNNWKDESGSSPQSVFPIGLTCNTNTKKWQWADGSAVDFKPPSGLYYSDLDRDCKSGCMWAAYSNGKWLLYCGTSTFTPHIFCTVQLPLLPESGCDNFQYDNEDDVCYEIGTTAESWQDAQMNCRKLGADLVHNAQENAFVRRLAVSQGVVNGLFLGATKSGKGDGFGWIDGSAWDYDNFFPGFPMSGFGECMAMDTSTPAGQWMNRDCSSKLPVACVRKVRTAVITEPTCNTGPWQENGVITSPGFPYNASMPCEYFLTVDKGQTVEAEIISLEANTCCDRLIIYDDYLGGNVIANLTGEVHNATYTTNTNFMRVSWQPNGGVNVPGLAMVFRGV